MVRVLVGFDYLGTASLKLGIITRADFGRGLAYQTQSFYSHLAPEVTVVVDMESVQGDKWPQDLDAYPDAIRTRWQGYTAPFDNPEALEALTECDVVYTAETYYDERLPELVNTVLHVNPEFWRHQEATRYWYPTVWRIKDLPPGEIVPTPIDDERIITDLPTSTRLLHVGGHRATGDRNGSQVIGSLIRSITHPWRLTSQDGMKIHPRTMAYVEVAGKTDDRWDLYEDCGILVYPRRYGGQSLVVNEAMARGMVVVMGDHSPNIETWPIVPVPTRPGGWVKTAGGRIQMGMVLTQSMTEIINALIADDEQRAHWQARSIMWARDHAWSQWKEPITKLLEDAAS